MERLTVDGEETTALRPSGDTRIECGWCGSPTKPERCSSCGRAPEQPWIQRGQEAPRIPTKAGRPGLDEKTVRSLWAQAKRELAAEGRPATLDAIAEKLDRDPRTVREWRVRFSLR